MMRARGTVVLFALTTFLSAFLLFQVQPLLSKAILPWFGGSPAVWTVCMLFFQVALFGGYVYAHLTTRHLPRELQAGLHVLLLAAAVFLGPITPAADWKPNAADDPTWHILSLLTACVGLPYFLLSTTGPLLQAWFARTNPGASPYRLYALSNVGSLLALLSYPIAFEPAFDIARQGALWSFGFISFAVCCALCGLLNALSQTETNHTAPNQTSSDASPDDEQPPPRADRWLWVGLAMTSCVMLLATTNQVCQEVAVIPFLWVLPLTLYLLSFILCFDGRHWYVRPVFLSLLATSAATSVWLMQLGGRAPLWGQLGAYFTMLFSGCMVCHGELVRLKPHPRYLTSFYLCLSAGGAAGGLFVGLLAPRLFAGFYEWHLGIAAMCVLPFIVLYRDPTSPLHHGRSHWLWAGLVAGVVALSIGLHAHYRRTSLNTIAASRNFFGVLKIEAGRESTRMKHGGVLHGMQFVAPDQRRQGTTYYGSQSGVGLILEAARPDRPLKVGLVGLGSGTTAVYGRKGDHFRFYEINPDVLPLAKRYFSFLSDCAAQVDHILGDARLRLEQEPPQAYDVLVLDAFSGDGVPVHLLTSEAFDIYRKHLRPMGVIAAHISNRHLDLRPVLLSQAERLKLQMLTVRHFPKASNSGTTVTSWVLLTADSSLLQHAEIQKHKLPDTTQKILWTDSRSDLWAILTGPH